jgi:hypothetical protein
MVLWIIPATMTAMTMTSLAHLQLLSDRQTNSFVEKSIEAGILLGGKVQLLTTC